MGLVFTPDQIKNISKDALLLPEILYTADNSYTQQKARLLGVLDNLEATDSDQKVYSDFWIDTVSKYHAELVLLNSIQRTNYLDSTLVSSGNKNGPHFPSDPIWTKFKPKMVDSNNGNPRSTLSDLHEQNHIDPLPTFITEFKTGFNDGSYDDTGIITGTTIETNNVSGLTVGMRLLAFSGSQSMIIRILTIDPGTPAQTIPIPLPAVPPGITFEILAGIAFSGAATLRAFWPGFSNNQRAEITPVTPYESIFADYKTKITNQINLWKSNVDAQKTILTDNGDLEPRKAQNQSALSNAISTVNTFTNWANLPTPGLSGRFTDSGLSTILSTITSRTAFGPTRISQIETSLGSVSQDAEGEYSGSGVYLELYKLIDLRVAFASGTLFSVNQILLGGQIFDQKIESGQNQLDQYNATFAITKISSDTESGQINFGVDSSSGFSVGDQVFVMDNGSAVFNRTIDLILGTNIKLNTGIPVALSKGALARIVKQK